jgi:DNA polymerase-3 subunit epsilon
VNNNQFDLDIVPDWAKRPIAVFDLETTGLNLVTSRIVTACALKLDPAGEVIGDSVEWLANPGVPIPQEASAVHGVTDEIAKAQGADLGETVRSIIETLSTFLNEGTPIVAYNAPYDFTILRQHAEDFGIPWALNPSPILDPLVLDKALVKFRTGKRRLDIIAPVYGVELTNAHNATADAVAAGRVAQAMAKQFASQLDLSLDELHQKQIAWSKEQDLSFADFMHRQGKTDFAPNIGWPEKPRS